jgi:alcohol dehydrogenase (cytochrome c)
MFRGSAGRLAGAWLILLATAAPAQTLPAAVMPLDAGGEWPAYNKDLGGQRYSPLHQIDTANVGSLKQTCRVELAPRGTFQAGPVVVGGTMYVTTATETFALDPVSCAIRWKHVYQPEEPQVLPVNRGVAYLDGKVFRGTGDGRLLAIDAATGRTLWEDVVGDPALGEFLPAAPIAWNGLVFIGTAGSDWGAKGRMLAFDAATGREVWRFDTIPTGNQPGADSWTSTEWATHGGGGTWGSFTLDPATAEIFVPVGNPAPDFSPAERPGANLYTDSMVVLDARNGALKWWYQLVPHDGHDLDLGAAPMLYRDSRQHRMVALGGKDGYVHAVDRETHQPVFKTAVTTIENEGKMPTPEGLRFCPGAAGGVEWNGPAFDRDGRAIVVGSVDFCMIERSQPGRYVAGQFAYGGSWEPVLEKPTGWVVAVDADTGAVRWRYHADGPVVAGVTVTAGGLVLTGDNDGNFLALDRQSGAVLAKLPTGGALSGGVVTYEIAGRQYIAFDSGNVSRTVFGAGGRPSIVVMQADAPLAVADAGKVDPARGGVLYGQSCAGCHGGDGANVTGHSLKDIKTRMTADQLAAWIENPAPPMPHVFPTPLDDHDRRDIRDLSAFLLNSF